MTNHLSQIKTIRNLFLDLLAQKKAYPQASCGRPRVCLKKIITGILIALLRGHTWREFPKAYGKKSTAHRYFREWACNGLFWILWKNLVLLLESQGKINLQVQIVDGSEKAVKNMSGDQAKIGYKHKSKRALKLTLIVDKFGIPLGLDVTHAACHDSKRLESALKNTLLHPSKKAPVVLLADLGYVGHTTLKKAAEYNRILLRPPKNRKTARPNKILHFLLKQRWRVEKAFKRLYDFKRVDFLLDKTLDSFLGWCYLAMAFICVFKF